MLTLPGEVTWPADYITFKLARTQKNLQTDLTKSLHISKFTARCARSNDLLHSALNEATKCECDDAMRRDRHRGIPASITRLPSGKNRATASALKTYKTHMTTLFTASLGNAPQPFFLQWGQSSFLCVLRHGSKKAWDSNLSATSVRPKK